jgi:membrane protein
VSLGFILLLVSLILNGALLVLRDRLQTFLPDVTVLLFDGINILISFVIITTLFAVIFRVLPDAKIAWKDVRSGAIFTAILFMLGRLAIGFYVESSANSSTYGAAGSLIAILLWVYYTAAILYFGAEFTKAYVDFKGKRIEPADYAVHVEQREVEHNVKKLPKKIDKETGNSIESEVEK